MRRSILGCLLAALFLGCGSGRIMVTVDVDSFMGEADLRAGYDVATVPPDLPPLAFAYGPQNVSIPEGLGEVSNVEEADLILAVRTRNTKGSGEVRVKLYFASEGRDPFAEAPAGELVAPFAPGENVVQETISLAPEVQMLFEESEVRFAYRIEVEGQPSAEGMQGEVLIEEITVRVVNDPNLGA